MPGGKFLESDLNVQKAYFIIPTSRMNFRLLQECSQLHGYHNSVHNSPTFHSLHKNLIKKQ